MKRIIIFLSGILILFSCNRNLETDQSADGLSHFDTIMKSKNLTVTLSYNSIDYYIYRGKPIGFQLELLNAFAKHMGLNLTIIIKDNVSQDFATIINKSSDILAGNIQKTSLRSNFLLFSTPHSKSRMVLVQRVEKDSLQVKKLIDLDGKTIYLPSQSSFSEYIINASFKQNFDPKLMFDKENTIENLIEMVSNKTINYTVCEEKVAKVYASYYDNIDFSIPISDTINLTWAFHPDNARLKDSADAWLNNFIQTKEYKRLYKKYYIVSNSPVGFSNTMDNRKQRRLSKFDKTLKKVSRQYHWDWRLYGAIIYQESKFQDGLIGDGGSFGILQVMPGTAERFGIVEGMSGDEQIIHGAKLIRHIEKKYEKEVTDKEQLWKFIIASFHTGSGHVDDARIIATMVGKNPNVWDHNVDSCMVLKSMPKYYRLPEVKSGYHYGKQTLHYVNNVWNRYLHYRNVFPN